MKLEVDDDGMVLWLYITGESRNFCSRFLLVNTRHSV